MNERNDLITTLVQVAHLYYEDGLSQQEIADRLSVSRSLIALYVKKAREQGIVRIEVVDPRNSCDNLATQLQDKFKLHHVIVVPSSHNSSALTRRALGSAVAAYLDRRLLDGDVLGLGWGRTISEVSTLLAPGRPRRIDVVPLLGESGYTGSYTQMNQIILQTARSFNGKAFFLLAPMLVGSSALRNALMGDDGSRSVTERWDRLTVACVGIGAVPPVDEQVVYIGEENITGLVDCGAVGDICARYFDHAGKFLDLEMNDRMVGVSLDQLKKAGSVIAVAGGVQKASAVVAALRTQVITSLFVDEALAQVLYEDGG